MNPNTDPRRNDDIVHRYGCPGGRIIVRRDGDEHVIDCNGQEPSEQWTKRAPAERTAVLPGEHLWAIPDNWTKIAQDSRPGVSVHGIYRIDGTDRYVRASIPNKVHLNDAFFLVKRVGSFELELANDQIDPEDVQATAASIDVYVEDGETIDEHPAGRTDDVVEVLEHIADYPHRFEDAFAEWHEPALDHLKQQLHDSDVPTTFDNGVINDPWPASVPLDTEVIERTVFGSIDDEVASAVVTELERDTLVTPRPSVSYRIDQPDQLRECYATRAAIEAGCSPSEAVDYLLVEVQEHTQSDVAEMRGVDQSTISKNVAGATGTLKR